MSRAKIQWFDDKRYLRRMPAGILVIVETTRKQQSVARMDYCTEDAVFLRDPQDDSALTPLPWGRIRRARIAAEGNLRRDQDVLKIGVDASEWRGSVLAVRDGVALVATIDGSENVAVDQLVPLPNAGPAKPPTRGRPGRPLKDPIADLIEQQVLDADAR